MDCMDTMDDMDEPPTAIESLLYENFTLFPGSIS